MCCPCGWVLGQKVSKHVSFLAEFPYQSLLAEISKKSLQWVVFSQNAPLKWAEGKFWQSEVKIWNQLVFRWETPIHPHGVYLPRAVQGGGCLYIMKNWLTAICCNYDWVWGALPDLHCSFQTNARQFCIVICYPMKNVFCILIAQLPQKMKRF